MIKCDRFIYCGLIVLSLESLEDFFSFIATGSSFLFRYTYHKVYPCTYMGNQHMTVPLRRAYWCRSCHYQIKRKHLKNNTVTAFKQDEFQVEKMYLLSFAPDQDSNQSAHPRNLIRVLIVRMKTLCFLGYPKCAQRRFWSDCANAQADMNLRLAHMFKCTCSDVSAKIKSNHGILSKYANNKLPIMGEHMSHDAINSSLTFRRINLSMRMPGPLVRSHV